MARPHKVLDRCAFSWICFIGDLFRIRSYGIHHNFSPPVENIFGSLFPKHLIQIEVMGFAKESHHSLPYGFPPVGTAGVAVEIGGVVELEADDSDKNVGRKEVLSSIVMSWESKGTPRKATPAKETRPHWWFKGQ